jgi:hypothetical protein
MSKIRFAVNKLNNYDNHYVTYSDKLSSACRRLAFAEGATLWAFKGTNPLSALLAIGFFILVCYFLADSLQYYLGMRDYEKLADNTRNILQKNKINYGDINKKNVNKRLEKCLTWKLFFIFISSAWLIIVFIKTFFICR